MIQQLFAKNFELQVVSHKTHEDRKSIQSDHDLLVTQNRMLENKLAQSKTDLNAKCLDLETRLEQSKMLSLADRKARSKDVRRAKEELEDAKEDFEYTKTELKLQIQCLKVAHRVDLTRVKEQRNEAIAALLERSSNQLKKELKAQKDETTQLRAALEDQKTTFGAQLAQKSLEVQELKLHQSSKQGSNKAHEELSNPAVSLAEVRPSCSLVARQHGHQVEVKAQLDNQLAVIEKLQQSVETSNRDWAQLRGSLQLGEEHDLATVERLLRQWQANPASQSHECDHSACEEKFLNDSNTILELRNTVSSLNSMLDAQESDMSSSTAESQEAARKAVLAVKGKEDPLQQKEKALEEEKAEREKAVEEKRRIAKEGFLYSNTLQAEVEGLKKGLKKALEDMTAGKAAQQEVERQRDELVRNVGELEGRMSRMVEVDMMEGVEFEN